MLRFHSMGFIGSVGFAIPGLVASAASAGLSQNSVTSPGGFIQVLAGPQTPGGGDWAGSDMSRMFSDPGSAIEESLFFGLSSASRSSSYSGGSIANGASGTVGMGYASMQAHNGAPNGAFFPEALANGGWTETFTITSAGLDGQQGYMQFTLLVNGSLSAGGFAGAASFALTAYKDHMQLMANSLFDPGNSDPLSTDRQYGFWGVSSAPDASRTVNGTVTMAVPFIYGTSFTLGIYAVAEAGMRSVSGVPGSSQASVEFQHTLLWGGIQNMYVGGTSTITSDYLIISGTGLDWSGTVPAPGAAWLLATAGLAGSRRRR